MDKRIIDYPEADSLSDDDYLVIDSEEGSPVKVKASDAIIYEEE